MRKLLAISVVVFLIFSLAGCGIDNSRLESLNSESSDAGVVVHGYASPGWIKNTNERPVRIKQVWIYHGEATSWMRTFQPGEVVTQDISHQHGFHVHSMEGVEIAFIRPTLNGHK